VGTQDSLRTKLRRDKRLSEAQMRSKRRTCLKFVSSGGRNYSDRWIDHLPMKYMDYSDHSPENEE
jgi:hypothetical protein